MNSGGDFAILNYINIYNWPDFSKIKEKSWYYPLKLEADKQKPVQCLWNNDFLNVF